MSKVTIEVDEDAIEVLDAFIKSQYSRRCWIRNIGSEDYFDGRSDWERAEEVRHPQLQNGTPSKYGIS